jgi:hypothetical protein
LASRTTLEMLSKTAAPKTKAALIRSLQSAAFSLSRFLKASGWH